MSYVLSKKTVSTAKGVGVSSEKYPNLHLVDVMSDTWYPIPPGFASIYSSSPLPYSLALQFSSNLVKRNRTQVEIWAIGTLRNNRQSVLLQIRLCSLRRIRSCIIHLEEEILERYLVFFKVSKSVARVL